MGRQPRRDSSGSSTSSCLECCTSWLLSQARMSSLQRLLTSTSRTILRWPQPSQSLTNCTGTPLEETLEEIEEDEDQNLEEDRTNGDDINAAVRELENTLEEIEESIDSEATEDEDYENSNDLGSGTDDDVEV